MKSFWVDWLWRIFTVVIFHEWFSQECNNNQGLFSIGPWISESKISSTVGGSTPFFYLLGCQNSILVDSLRKGKRQPGSQAWASRIQPTTSTLAPAGWCDRSTRVLLTSPLLHTKSWCALLPVELDWSHWVSRAPLVLLEPAQVWNWCGFSYKVLHLWLQPDFWWVLVIIFCPPFGEPSFTCLRCLFYHWSHKLFLFGVVE